MAVYSGMFYVTGSQYYEARWEKRAKRVRGIESFFRGSSHFDGTWRRLQGVFIGVAYQPLRMAALLSSGNHFRCQRGNSSGWHSIAWA
jgi:hypothetical protein